MFCSLIMGCPQKGFRDSVGEAQRQAVASAPIFPHSLRYYLDKIEGDGPNKEKDPPQEHSATGLMWWERRDRTLDRRIKSPLLYQLSYAPRRLIEVVGRARFELTTNGLKVRCSTD